MKYVAVMIIGRNTFLRLALENNDDSWNEVSEDAENLAHKLGAKFLYLEDVPE